jgi:hypothetical protein
MTFEYDWERMLSLGYTEDAVESLKKSCWKGYEAVGTKKKGGRTVPNCVPKAKKKSKDQNFSENPFESDEPNGGMLITQLRVMQEKIDMMLQMMEPDDNLEPWVATKIANAGVAVASVADYLRFGGET